VLSYLHIWEYLVGPLTDTTTPIYYYHLPHALLYHHLTYTNRMLLLLLLLLLQRSGMLKDSKEGINLLSEASPLFQVLELLRSDHIESVVRLRVGSCGLIRQVAKAHNTMHSVLS
jgi:hypothetical protein